MEKIIPPLLPWIGGKRRLLPVILENIPDRIENYIEPFLGGGAVLFGVLCTKKIYGKIIACDLNPYLIATYKNIRDHLEDVFVYLLKMRSYSLRSENLLEYRKSLQVEFNQMSMIRRLSPKGSAIFYYLVKSAYRSLYKEDEHLNLRMTFYDERNRNVFDEAHLNAISELIQDVEFFPVDFRVSLKKANKNSFVYLDPPYVKVGSAFDDYQVGGFQGNLKEFFFILKNFPGRFLLSNSDSSRLIREFSNTKKFKIKLIPVKRMLKSKDEFELLIKNYQD